MTPELLVIGLAVAALVLVGVELVQAHADLLAWAVLLLAVAELVARIYRLP